MKPEYTIDCEFCGRQLKVEYWADDDIFVQEVCCEPDTDDNPADISADVSQ